MLAAQMPSGHQRLFYQHQYQINHPMQYQDHTDNQQAAKFSSVLYTCWWALDVLPIMHDYEYTVGNKFIYKYLLSISHVHIDPAS